MSYNSTEQDREPGLGIKTVGAVAALVAVLGSFTVGALARPYIGLEAVPEAASRHAGRDVVIAAVWVAAAVVATWLVYPYGWPHRLKKEVWHNRVGVVVALVLGVLVGAVGFR